MFNAEYVAAPALLQDDSFFEEDGEIKKTGTPQNLTIKIVDKVKDRKITTPWLGYVTCASKGL